MFTYKPSNQNEEPVVSVDELRDGDVAVIEDGGYAGELVMRSSEYLFSLVSPGRVWQQRPLPPLNVRKLRAGTTVTAMVK